MWITMRQKNGFSYNALCSYISLIGLHVGSTMVYLGSACLLCLDRGCRSQSATEGSRPATWVVGRTSGCRQRCCQVGVDERQFVVAVSLPRFQQLRRHRVDEMPCDS